ncbi:hypothetical protein COCNU_scaffold006459G000020 [Cocos nucifera]|nr:hypothetical protein [Cocos nucifera]
MLGIFLSFLVDLEMDNDAMERLTKGLYVQKKRKEAAPDGSSKRAKIGSLCFEVLDVPAATPKVVLGTEVLSIIEGSIEGVGSQSPASSSLPTEGPVLEPHTEREGEDGDDKKKKKATIMKVVFGPPHTDPPQEDKSPGGGSTEGLRGSSSQDRLPSRKGHQG